MVSSNESRTVVIKKGNSSEGSASEALFKFA